MFCIILLQAYRMSGVVQVTFNETSTSFIQFVYLTQTDFGFDLRILYIKLLQQINLMYKMRKSNDNQSSQLGVIEKKMMPRSQ